MESRVAGVTVRRVLPDLPPNVAVIVVEPSKTDVPIPSEPGALLMIATLGVPEPHVTNVVRSWLVIFVPSEKTPVAVNRWLVPREMLGFVGETPMDTRVAEVTVRIVFPETLPNAAATVVEPAETDIASPALSIVATPIFDELHVTCVVRSWLLLSEKIPVAINC